MNIIFCKGQKAAQSMRQIKKPEEIIMLSKLKAIIAKANKTAVILAVMLVLSGISLNSYIYDDTIQVHINVDGVTVKTVNTKAGTVGDILANEKFFCRGHFRNGIFPVLFILKLKKSKDIKGRNFK